MTHVLEHVPSAGRYAECSKVPKINTLLRTATEDVHGIVHEGCRMAFARNRYVANAVELTPGVRARVVSPYVVEPSDAVSTAKPAFARVLVDGYKE